ncbi:hypothetical protein [Nannocystis pusilla]|uniref:hypothetical protein n=1 Tax=Nannocystis pusilla TaxID=889268 RepID=UPI003B76BE28
MRHEVERGCIWPRGHVLKDNMTEKPVAAGEACEQRQADGEGIDRAGAGEADRDREAVLLDEGELLDRAGTGVGAEGDLDAREDLFAEQCLDGQELHLVELAAAVGVGAGHELDDLRAGEDQLGGDPRVGDPQLGLRQAALVRVRGGRGAEAGDRDEGGADAEAGTAGAEEHAAMGRERARSCKRDFRARGRPASLCE